MAKYDVGLRLGVEGNKEFKNAVKEINNELKTFDSALKLVESQYAGQLNSMEALSAKGEVLQDLYEKQKEKIQTLASALQNAQNAEKEYAAKVTELKSHLAGAQSEMERLKNSTCDTTAEQQRLEAQIDELTKELKANENGYSNAKKQVDDWQRQLNLANVQLNKLDSEIKDNKRYLSEAEKATDKCAKSIDGYGKKVKDASEKSNILKKIFAGGFLANIASQAVNALVSKLKEFAKAAMETAGELVKISTETGMSTTKLQELQYVVTALDGDLTTIERAQAKLTRSMDDARRGSTEYAGAFRRLGIEIQNADGTLRDATDVMFETFDALNKVGSEADRDAIALRLFGRSAMELNPLIKAGADELKRLSEEAHKAGAVMSEEVVEALDIAGDRLDLWKLSIKAKVGEAIVAIGKWLNGGKIAVNDSIENLESLQDEIEKLETSYESAALAAQESIQNQMGLFEDMSKTANKTFSEIKQSIYSQLQWLEDYTANLANLQSRNVEGIDKLVDKLADGTKESAAILAGLATASDAELKSLIDRMAEVDSRQEGLARQIAQIQTGAQRQLNEIFTGMRESAKKLDASDIAEQAGRDTVQGYIAAVKAKTKSVTDAFRKLAKAANDAYKDELKIKSPSRVAMQTTEDYFKGHIVAAKAMTAQMEAAYTEPARKAQMAVESLVLQSDAPKPDYAAQAAMIGESISKALAGAPAASGRGALRGTFNIVVEIDGRQVARSTREYLIEEAELAGVNLIEG